MAEEEGWELRREYRTWRELYGIPSGMHTTHGPLRQRTGDPGWATNERDRIANEAGEEFWLLAMQQPAPAFKELTTAREAGGWRVIEEWGFRRVWLRR